MLPEQSLTEYQEEVHGEANAGVSTETSKRKRQRRSSAEIEALVRKFYESGLTRAKFARKQGIPIQTIHSWLRKKRGASKPQSSSGSRPAGFVPVQLKKEAAGTSSTPSLRLELASGSTLLIPEGFSTTELARVLLVLERC